MTVAGATKCKIDYNAFERRRYRYVYEKSVESDFASGS
jgi:hypothetical protein